MTVVRRTLPPLFCVALVLVSCGDQHGSSDEAASYRGAMDAVCQAQTFASQREYRAASDAFYDNAHAFLHAFAARVQERDAAAAGKLLETKEQVEVTFRDPSFYGSEVIVRRLLDLQDAMRGAAQVLGLPEVGCAA
jgi:hypothetical protein